MSEKGPINWDIQKEDNLKWSRDEKICLRVKHRTKCTCQIDSLLALQYKTATETCRKYRFRHFVNLIFWIIFLSSLNNFLASTSFSPDTLCFLSGNWYLPKWRRERSVTRFLFSKIDGVSRKCCWLNKNWRFAWKVSTVVGLHTYMYKWTYFNYNYWVGEFVTTVSTIGIHFLLLEYFRVILFIDPSVTQIPIFNINPIETK